MKIKTLLEGDVIDAAERFRKRPDPVRAPQQSAGIHDAIMADISKIIQPRWNKKFTHDLIDKTSHAEDDYVTRLYLHLPYPGEPMAPQNRIAYTIFKNNKDMILGMLEDERQQLDALLKKYKGIVIFTKIINDYIVATDMLIDGFSTYQLS